MVLLTGAGPAVISAWSAISPWGLTTTEFTAGLRSGRATASTLDRTEWTVPVERACLVPGFDVREEVGRKGTRALDRATGLAVAAVGRLLAGDGRERLSGVVRDTGLALGTSTGSAQSMMDFTRESMVGRRPYLVDPARFPSTVMNCAAGQAAIWHHLEGPNTTVASGRATGLTTLQYALRLQRAGRARTLLCGAVEEFSAARAWLAWHSGGGAGTTGPVLGEGAVVWLLEPADDARAHGRVALAEPIGLRFGFARDSAAIRPVLADCLRRLLDRTGVAPADVALVADSQQAGADGDAEWAAVCDVLGAARPRRVGCAADIGDTFAASAAFQVAAVLACAGSDPAPGRVALVTSTEAGGVVAAAALRLLDPAPDPDLQPTDERRR